jgi:sRNA-binding regulator protein Hfq
MARRNSSNDELSRLNEENLMLKSKLKELSNENEGLKAELTNVKREYEVLKNRVAEIDKGLGVTVEPLVFIKSLQRDLIDAHLHAIKQETDTTYVISDLNIQLKALVTQRGNATVLSLPASKEDLTFKDAMSTISINMKPVPLLTQPKPKASIPVESIEGIGTKIGNILRSRNINTVRDLASADVKDLISVGISEKMAREFIGMARLMLESEFAGIEGIDEQAAELLIRAGKVDSKEKLASSDPQELFNVINNGIKEGLVKVPRDYTLTLDDVKRWIESARRKTR